MRSFGVVYSQIQNKNLPPLEFLLDLYREPNLFQVNCDKGTESLSFVSNKMMSRFFSCGINVQLSTLQNLQVLIFSTSKVLGYTNLSSDSTMFICTLSNKILTNFTCTNQCGMCLFAITTHCKSESIYIQRNLYADLFLRPRLKQNISFFVTIIFYFFCSTFPFVSIIFLYLCCA